jgi:hypothetical protein
VKERICVESTENRRAGVETGAGICNQDPEGIRRRFCDLLNVVGSSRCGVCGVREDEVSRVFDLSSARGYLLAN